MNASSSLQTLTIDPGPVTTVTLNRPEVRNAFNETLIDELSGWAASVPADGSVRVVVLQGAGAVFSAGADLRWMSRMLSYSHEENLADARRAARMYHLLDTLPVPVIGRVQGAALGGGAGLAAICDVVVAADDAVFGFTEVTLGILPAMISPYVVRKIGLSHARQLCLTGARFSAAQARDWGLVHEVVTLDQPGGPDRADALAGLDDAVGRFVAAFLKGAPSAIAATKALLRDVAGRAPADVLALTVEAIASQRVSPEGQEGMRAFLEKRPPSWTPGGDRRS